MNYRTKLTKQILRVGIMAFCLCLFTQSLIAQRTITGTVTDADSKESLIGASVLVQGTTSGTSTDLDGKYSISVPESAGAIVFSYTGYVDKVIELGTSDVIDVTLKEQSVGLEEVTVTARRVEESAQNIPVAITVFTPEELVSKGAVQMDEVARFTPNLIIDNAPAVSGAGFGTTIFIRGIGQNDFAATSDPGVGVYVDGIYIARTIGTLFEMQGAQVEVLRGPQGTTFGRNTVGGAINITTPKPTTDKVFGSAEVTAGNYNLYQLRSSINLPVSEKTAARVSAVYRNRGGYATRLQDGGELGDDNTFFLRGKLNSIIGENLVLDFAADYTRTRANSAVSTLLDANPGAFPFGVLYNQLVGNAVDPMWITNDPFTTNATGPSINNLDAFGASASAKLELGETTTSKLILGYRNMDAQFSRDGDNTPFPYRHTNNTYSSSQVSAELQFFNSKPSKLKWLAGLFFMNESVEDNAEVDLATGLYDGLEAAVDSLVPGPWGGAGNPANGGLDLELFVKNKVAVTNLAAFFNASYNFTDAFSISGGIRASQDSKTYEAEHQRLNTEAYIVPPGTEISGEWASVTGKFGAEYKVNDNLLTYVSASNGFKSGGFNSRPIRSEDGIQPYDPEKVWTYELGMKSDIGKSTRLNIATYFSDYQDIQVSFVNTPEIVVRNAARAEVLGFEVELFTKLGKDFMVNAGFGYTDAAYTETDTLAQVTTDTKFLKAPKTQFSIGAGYTPALTDKIDLAVRLDYNHQAEAFQDPANTPILLQPAYGLLSGRIGILISDKYEIAVWAKNLTDEQYLVSGLTSAAFGVTEGSYGAPRTMGASFRYKF